MDPTASGPSPTEGLDQPIEITASSASSTSSPETSLPSLKKLKKLKKPTKNQLDDLLAAIPPPKDVKFNPIQMTASFAAKAKLPPDTEIYYPCSLFSRFIPPEIFATISLNTNRYAEIKKAGSGRLWRATTTGEVRVFIGILIYMGVHKSPAIEDYWTTELPGHNLGK